MSDLQEFRLKFGAAFADTLLALSQTSLAPAMVHDLGVITSPHDTLLDTLYRPVMPTCPSYKVHVWFIDLEPEANWAHNCAYFCVCENTGIFGWYPSRMPPKDMP